MKPFTYECIDEIGNVVARVEAPDGALLEVRSEETDEVKTICAVPHAIQIGSDWFVPYDGFTYKLDGRFDEDESGYYWRSMGEDGE